MNAYRAPFALLTVIMLTAALPAAMWYIGAASGLTTTTKFLVTLVPVALAILTAASWLEPR
ncbi:hypothetical protein [Halobaculum sp. D14]|uniref:hypothetical protein n=1 Tax=Halobaculum sp. D14 TaxID=3421642 RepID=UPI003EBAA94F